MCLRFRSYARASRALESFTSRFVSLVTLTGAAGVFFGLPRGELLLDEPRCRKTFEMRRRRPKKWTSGGSKIELSGRQTGLLEVSGWDSGAAGRRQVAAKTAPKPFLGSSASALGSSWARPGALWALLGAVLGRPEGPRELLDLMRALF